MKINWNDPICNDGRVKPSFTTRLARAIAVLGLVCLVPTEGNSQTTADQAISIPAPASDNSRGAAPTQESIRQIAQSTPQALALVDQVINRLAHGAPFFCDIRQRVWAAGGESMGVGTYIQVGRGTGQFSMQVSMHDGDAKHTLLQMSDGRLAYTRTEVGKRVSLIRVDVGSLDEGARVLRRTDPVKPSMLVGGPIEMLDTIRRDYHLRVGTSQLNGQKLLVLIGTIKPLRKQAIAPTGNVPNLFPSHLNVMIAAEDDPKTGFGKGLPVRIEHRSAPKITSDEDATGETTSSIVSQGSLISLIEFYSIHPMNQLPSIKKFRFENQDAAVTFVNETKRYEDRFDIRVSARERAKFR